MAGADLETLKKVTEYVRNPIIFSEEYFDQGKSRNIEQDQDLQRAYDAIIKKKVQQIVTLQQLLSTLDTKADQEQD